MNLDVQHLMRQGTLNLPAFPPLSIYIHLPWCIKKCPYCDFNSHEWRQGGLNELPEQHYLDALRADLEASLPLIWGRPVHSIFIGGGTPSLFSPAAIDRLISDLRSLLPLVPDCEITLEANPGTFEKDKFFAFRAAGVTRLSVGVQSFNDQHLQIIGRVHNGQQAMDALTEASRAFETFNLDLMYALPTQTLAQFDADLKRALSVNPPHLSIYHLTIEPNTLFAKHKPSGLPDDDHAYEMLDRIVQTTQKANMARYEVSAFAKKGHACWHNTNYWQFGDYLGLGAGAHSKISFPHRVMRLVRHREPLLYMQKAMQASAVAQSEEVKRDQLPFEFMLNALRLKDGFDLKWYSDRTGLPISSISKALDEAKTKGWIEADLQRVVPTTMGFDFLSDLQSLFLADA